MRLRTVSEFMAPQEHVFFNRDDLYVPSDTHQHEFVELEYILSGEGTQVVNGNEFHVKRGDVILLEVGKSHSYHSKSGLEILNCIIDPDFYAKMKRDILKSCSEPSFFLPDHMTLSGKHFVETENMLFSMEQEFKQQQPCYRLMLDNYISSFLITLHRNSQEREISKNDRLQKQFIEYVEKNFAYCSLQSTALYFGYSISHFSRLFKQTIGQNFSEYVSQRKLKEAMDLLSNTAFSIDTICHQLGYKDRTQFHKLFHDHLGMTPNQYRKQKISRPE